MSEATQNAVTLREFVLGDIPAIAEIRNRSISISPDFYSMTVDRFRFETYDEDVPLTSRIMVAEAAAAEAGVGRVVGFYHLYTDENQLARGRVNLDAIHVHPDARSEGAGAALIRSALETAEQWGGRYVSTAIPEDSPRSLAFLERHGFKRVRTFFKMRLSKLEAKDAAFPVGMTLATFRPGKDEAAFVAVYNAAFADHWDFTPLTEAEVSNWNKRPAFNPRGCFLLWEGEKLVAFTTVLYDPDQAAHTGEAVARIFEMGVLPEYRQRGLAYGLLQAAIRYAAERGFSGLDLVTDAENEAGVLLYEKVGFQEKRSTIVLHREVRTAPRD